MVMKRIDSETYRLSSGREFYANDGLISIAREADGTFSIREGYDGDINGMDDAGDWMDDVEIKQIWSADERKELADFMIAQWTDFKESQR
jgi:hypothetical protein